MTIHIKGGEDLNRRYLLEVTCDGIVFVRDRDDRPARPAVSIAIFSTDTFDQAKRIRDEHCLRIDEGHRLRSWPHSEILANEFVRRLSAVAARFRDTWAALPAQGAA